MCKIFDHSDDIDPFVDSVKLMKNQEIRLEILETLRKELDSGQIDEFDFQVEVFSKVGPDYTDSVKDIIAKHRLANGYSKEKAYNIEIIDPNPIIIVKNVTSQDMSIDPTERIRNKYKILDKSFYEYTNGLISINQFERISETLDDSSDYLHMINEEIVRGDGLRLLNTTNARIFQKKCDLNTKDNPITPISSEEDAVQTDYIGDEVFDSINTLGFIKDSELEPIQVGLGILKMNSPVYVLIESNPIYDDLLNIQTFKEQSTKRMFPECVTEYNIRHFTFFEETLQKIRPGG